MYLINKSRNILNLTCDSNSVQCCLYTGVSFLVRCIYRIFVSCVGARRGIKGENFRTFTVIRAVISSVTVVSRIIYQQTKILGNADNDKVAMQLQMFYEHKKKITLINLYIQRINNAISTFLFQKKSI